MSSYRKTMRQALEEMHDMLNEAEDFKPHKMYDPKTGKAYDAKTMDDHLRMKKKGYDHEKPKDEDEDENEIDESLWANIAAKRKRIKAGSGEKMRKPGEKGAPTPDQMAKAKNEEIELDEASKYDLYHKDFSGAMQHAYKMAKKLHGITISPDEISDKVATGPRKPSEGKTNKYRLEGDKGGIQIQVYNKGGSKPFELNMYKEEVELDESQWGAPDKLTPVQQAHRDHEAMGHAHKEAAESAVKAGYSHKEVHAHLDKHFPGGIHPTVRTAVDNHFAKKTGVQKNEYVPEDVELDEASQAFDDVLDMNPPNLIKQASGDNTPEIRRRTKGAAMASKNAYAKLRGDEKKEADEYLKTKDKPHKLSAEDEAKLKKESANELDEAKMSSSQIAMLKKAYEPMRDKKIGVENADRLSKMMNKVARDKEALMQLFKADIPFVSQSAVTKLITKHGMKGAEINKLREGHEINEVLPFVVGAAARLAAPIITRKLAATGARKLATGAVRAATGVAKTAASTAATAATANAAPPSDDAQQERDNARAQAERQRAADQAAQQDAAQRKAAAYGMTTEASAYSDARRAMASDPSTRQKFSKNISASDDDIKSADKNIIMQLRDVVSLKGVGKLTLKPSEEKKLKKSGSGYTKTAGSGFVEFANGRKEKVDLKIAQAILDKYNKQRKPSDKERFQAKISKSKKDMLKALKETNQIDKNRTSLSKVKNFMKENEEK
jgi:hypothetical protein